MNISRKHHILPEFYLKGFTNEKEQLAIFKAKERRIKKGWHSPSSHFFVNDRNTVQFNGIMLDVPEQAFSMLDGRMALIFKKIQECHGVPKLSVHEMTGIYYFLSNLFWRSPDADGQFEKAVNIQAVRSLFSSPVMSDKDLINFIRPMAGTWCVEQSGTQNFKDWKIVYNPNGAFVCSDRPFMARVKKDIFGSDFIVPLTKHHLLIKCACSFTHIPAQFLLFVQCLLIQQAREYCAAADKQLFEAMLNDPSYYSIEFFRDMIFEFIEEEEERGQT